MYKRQLLVYPTVIIAVIGAIPTFVELYKSWDRNIPFGMSRMASEENKLWKKNFECSKGEFLSVKNELNICLLYTSHTLYLFRITREDGSVAYRTDLYSRCQIGSGGKNPDAPAPGAAPWNGTRQDLDGTKSCSVVVDPDRIVRPFRQLDAGGNPVWPETDWVDEAAFWRDEFDPNRPLPTRIDDLVI